MAKIDNPNDLWRCFNISKDCETSIHQLYNTHKEKFLKPFAGICGGIKRQAKEILDNEHEYPPGIFRVKTNSLKVVYYKETLQITAVSWIGER